MADYEVLMPLRRHGVAHEPRPGVELLLSMGETEAAPLVAIGALRAVVPVAQIRVDGSPAVVASAEGKTNLNTATKDELVLLDAIGPATADRIIKGRPYESLEQARLASKLGEEPWAAIVDSVFI